jgi:small-conductance mechanosensitive channel
MVLEEACGDEPGLLCRLVYERTGDPQLAEVVDVVVGRPLRIIIIIAVAVLVWQLGRRAIDRFSARYEAEIRRRLSRADELGVDERGGRSETRRIQRLFAVVTAGRSALAIVVGITAGLLVLAQFVDLRPVLAGAGLAGLVVGFGAQNLIADLLAGFSMLVEDAYGVGDWIDVDGRIGEVERVGLRATSFRDIDGTVWHLPNGRINGVGNLTQRWARATLDVPLALDTDIAHARRIVQQVADGLAADPEWADDVIAPPEIWGVTAWGADGVTLRLVIPTRPLRNWDVNRQMRERLKARFEEEGIRMPVPQREVGGRGRDSLPVAVADVPTHGPLDRSAHPAGRGHDATTEDLREDTGRIATEYGRIRPQRSNRER